MVVKLDLIAAACENMGIGKNNDLPWRLKSEMAYFTKMTSKTENNNMKNVVLMGRKTWDSVPPKFKPFKNRINFVLSRSHIDVSRYENVYAFTSLEKAIEKLEQPEFQEKYENVWVIGGSQIYKAVMDSDNFHRLYLTNVLKNFDCDTFFPKLSDSLVKVSDSRVPEEVQEENGIKFVYNVYENPNFKK